MTEPTLCVFGCDSFQRVSDRRDQGVLVDHNREAEHWHCDETCWRVFVHQADKAGFVWYLWVFAAAESIVFVLDPTRAHDVPEDYFGDDAEGIIADDCRVVLWQLWRWNP